MLSFRNVLQFGPHRRCAHALAPVLIRELPHIPASLFSSYAPAERTSSCREAAESNSHAFDRRASGLETRRWRIAACVARSLLARPDSGAGSPRHRAAAPNYALL